MLLQSPLQVITATLDADVLGVLARRPEAFTIPQLSAMISSRSIEGIRKTLRRLVAHGVVTVESVGRTQLFRLNREHLAAPLIEELANLKATFIAKLARELSQWPTPPEYAALFGSAARGTMSVTSDIDLFLLRPEGTHEEEFSHRTAQLAQVASRWLGNDVRPLIYGVDEIRDSQSDHAVLTEIITQGEAIFGNDEALRAAVARP
jgi:predicted nucleotidyltransferase